MWYAIVIDDPALFEKRSGEKWNAGDAYSFGTDIAPRGVLASKGLVSVEIGEGPPNFEHQRWNKDSRSLEPWQMNRDDMAGEIAEVEARLAALRAIQDTLPEGKGDSVSSEQLAKAVDAAVTSLRG